MAIATPGSTAATSRRDRPTAPARPVAIAAMRSTTVGEVRLVIWSLVCTSMSGTTRAATTPTRTTTTAPQNTNRPARIRSRFTRPSAMPMIGVESGAMIMAPMTVAVESASTPAVAMTAESTSMVQNADCLARVSPDLRSRSSDSSSRVRRWFSGSTRSRRPMFMALSMPVRRPAAPGTAVRPRPAAALARASRRGPGPPRRYRRDQEVTMGPSRTVIADRTLAVVVATSVVALALAGCTSDPEPTPMPTVSFDSTTAPATPTAIGVADRASSPSPSASATAARHPCRPGSRSTRRARRPSPTSAARIGGIGVVRVGHHTGFDRVVWQFPGSGRPDLPGALRRRAHGRRQRRRRRRGRRRLPRGDDHDGRHPGRRRATAAQGLRVVDRRHRRGRRPCRSTAGSRATGRRSSACATGSGRSRSPCCATRPGWSSTSTRAEAAPVLPGPAQRRSSSRCQDCVR